MAIYLKFGTVKGNVTADGYAGQEAVITFVRTGAKVQEYMTYKLSDCIISHYDIDAGDEDDLVERIQLSYSAIEVGYKDHDGVVWHYSNRGDKVLDWTTTLFINKFTREHKRPGRRWSSSGEVP